MTQPSTSFIDCTSSPVGMVATIPDARTGIYADQARGGASGVN